MSCLPSIQCHNWHERRLSYLLILNGSDNGSKYDSGYVSGIVYAVFLTECPDMLPSRPEGVQPKT